VAVIGEGKRRRNSVSARRGRKERGGVVDEVVPSPLHPRERDLYSVAL